MYQIEIEQVDYQTGRRDVRTLPRTFKTLKGAELAAARIGCIVRPNGGPAVSETWGRVKR